MGQQPASVRILAGAFTALALGLAWMAIASSLPSEQELSAKESPMPVSTATGSTPPAPTLDLSIPGVPPAPPVPSSHNQTAASVKTPSVVASSDPRAAQVVRLRCEAEAEQLCGDSPEGPARKQCLEKRMQALPGPCQLQLRERFVKWKEERSRLTAACQVDIKRLCSAQKPGGGHVLQCLQEHAQDLSDSCYETLPKGRVYFKQ